MTRSSTLEKPENKRIPPRDVMRKVSPGSPTMDREIQHAANRIPRILCIDDDPEICRTLEMRLGQFHAEVVIAYFGTQGFWEAITDRPDLVLMDVVMPSGDGRFVLESLRSNKSTESIPVIVLTGKREEKLKSEMLALGADRYLNKPVHFDVLLREIRDFLDLRPRST